MSDRQVRKFKEALAAELRVVAQVLQDEDLIREQQPLLIAATDAARARIEKDRNRWHYRCEELVLIVDQEHLQHYRNTRPVGLQELEIELTIDATGTYQARPSLADPFTSLQVDCVIKAHAKGESFVCSWHLDRNVGDSEDASKHFVHPCYHFQYGGYRLPDDLGRLLFVEPPRIAHPPLDAILAIDFVLTNYFPDTWRTLRQEGGRYSRIVRQAQHRCWRPYAKAGVSRWSGEGTPLWPAESIWPQLIPVDNLDGD